MTVTSANWNGTLAPGASTAVKAKFTGAAAAPSAISCSGVAVGLAATLAVQAAGVSGEPAGRRPEPQRGPGYRLQPRADQFRRTPLIAFKAPSASDHRPGTSPTAVREAAVLFFLALVEKEEPSAAGSDGKTVDTALLAQVGHLVAGGNEPDADGGLKGGRTAWWRTLWCC